MTHYFPFRCWFAVVMVVSASGSSLMAEEPVTQTDREHWSYLPVKRPALPSVSDMSQVRNPIDLFIAASLESQQLKPMPEASRTTLLRRLKLDLTGLPPTQEERRAFSSDGIRYEELVERFLASPRYGERWAQPWLDLARFAETDGFEHDKVRAKAWRYRDWVIEALNRDMPYDDFIRWQLAGDEFAPHDPAATTATAFCLSGPDMPDINSQDERRHNLLNEMTSTVGAVLMGLQIGCAQCHDHKYDTISQADFYRMRAIFDPAVTVEKNKSIFALANAGSAKPAFLMERGDYRRPGDPIAPGFVRIANLTETSLDLPATQPFGRRTALAEWLTDDEHPLTARVVVNRIWQQHFGVGITPTPSDFGVMGEPPSHPELLDWLATELVRQNWSLKSLHRLIVTSQTYRRASHAVEFGWNDNQRHLARRRLKAAQEKDPANRLLARFPRRRLEGEVVRDVMLALAGELNLQAGGPSVRPPLPPEMLKTLLRGQWKATEDQTQHSRRSVYVFARRNLRFPIFDVFDRPDANATCAQRNESTTATQSLLMLNSQTSLDAARLIAQRALKSLDGNVVQAGAHCFSICFGRAPDALEHRLITEFVEHRGRESDAECLTDLCLGFLNSNEFIYVD